MELVQLEGKRDRARQRERERERKKKSGLHVALGVSAQLFSGAAAAIHLDTACSTLASELSSLVLCVPLKKRVKLRNATNYRKY